MIMENYNIEEIQNVTNLSVEYIKYLRKRFKTNPKF